MAGSTRIIGLDPGPEESALVEWTGDTIGVRRMGSNEDIITDLRKWGNCNPAKVPLVIEQIASMGMAVGAETFETCVWTGRFMEAYGPECTFRIKRADIKLHLCHSMRAKDANIRQAILDRFGGKDKAIGKKASPGPLAGVTSHLWSALAVALVFADQMGEICQTNGKLQPMP